MGVSRRAIAASCASPRRSKARARRSASAVAASLSSARSASTLRISGCSIRRLPKAMRCAVWFRAMRQRLPHQAAGAQRAVEPRHRAHLEDLRDAAAFLADQPGRRAVELDFGAGVGLVAQLVLQALDADRVAAAVGQHARQEQAAQAGRGLRQHQEGVAHRRREEPLVAGDAVARAPVVAASGSARVVLARTSEPPCFSVMPMPMVTPALSRQGFSAGRSCGW
jgi:hypothetical protein